jgi:hypothetical protein
MYHKYTTLHCNKINKYTVKYIATLEKRYLFYMCNLKGHCYPVKVSIRTIKQTRVLATLMNLFLKAIKI